MTGWQDIITAPKDGTKVLVWRPDEGDGIHFAGAEVDQYLGPHGGWWRSRLKQQPTHWMPLPLSPTPAPKED